MKKKNAQRPCSATKEWASMTIEEKVETLGTWADQMCDWAEATNERLSKMKEVMRVLHDYSNELARKTNPFSTKDSNGIPPTPKSPKTPGC